ncbi:hypothetical protein [Thiocystis violacea]|uniref:hypothetical protein n=1 Tax=Thiocystis violacea TaxID=13725 RepID=UPI0019042C44|nr:hypothetical protein [Thiocystis violacea]MBK1719238.1 hypothetical protein [Thiocystis violacea]
MPLPDTSVKYFSSDMPGAPVLSGTAGALIAVLDACLVNGFGSVTVDSLSVEDGIATAIVSAGHGLAMVGNTGPVILVEGATPAWLNGEWRVASVGSATTLTFAVEGVADGAASGAITVRRAPAGWAKPFSGTNKAVYARTEPDTTAMVLRVDDTPAQYPTLIMYESMTDVDTGAGSSTPQYTVKSAAANTTGRPWRIVADGYAVYWFIKYDAGTWYGNGLFGDPIKANSTDAYFCMLIASTSASANTSVLHNFGSSNGGEICRSHTQVGGAVPAGHYASALQTTRVGSGGMGNYPNPVDNNLLASPILVFAGGYYRGVRPGMCSPLHDGNPPDGTIVDNVIINAAPRTVLAQYMIIASNKCVAIMDLTGPWR